MKTGLMIRCDFIWFHHDPNKP